MGSSRDTWQRNDAEERDAAKAAQTPSKIADPLLPEQIAELRALYQRCMDLSERASSNEYAETYLAFEDKAMRALPQLLSAAERGIAAGEEVERLKAEVFRRDLCLQDLTAGGSEFVNDPERCRDYAKETRTRLFENLKAEIIKRKKAEADLAAAEQRAFEAESFANMTITDRERSLRADLAASKARIGELSKALTTFREHVIKNATEWLPGAGSHHHPLWQTVADALLTPTHPETERTGSLSSSSQTEGEG